MRCRGYCISFFLFGNSFLGEILVFLWATPIETRKMPTIDHPQKRLVCMQHYDSPCGELLLASADEELCLCDWSGKPCAERNRRRLGRLLQAEFCTDPSAVLTQTMRQLDEYFAGRRKVFDLPLRPVGTDFQRRVWEALLEIPYGETRSYKEIARRVGNLDGIRAVAQAIGANGLSIVIPCHRVIGSNRSLTGFAGGLEAKRILLNLESSHSTAGRQLFR